MGQASWACCDQHTPTMRDKARCARDKGTLCARQGHAVRATRARCARDMRTLCARHAHAVRATCARCARDMRTLCARHAHAVRATCARCARDMRTLCARQRTTCARPGSCARDCACHVRKVHTHYARDLTWCSALCCALFMSLFRILFMDYCSQKKSIQKLKKKTCV